MIPNIDYKWVYEKFTENKSSFVIFIGLLIGAGAMYLLYNHMDDRNVDTRVDLKECKNDVRTLRNKIDSIEMVHDDEVRALWMEMLRNSNLNRERNLIDTIK